MRHNFEGCVGDGASLSKSKDEGGRDMDRINYGVTTAAVSRCFLFDAIFYSLKVRATDVACLSCLGVAVTVGKRLVPTNKVTSASWNGVKRGETGWTGVGWNGLEWARVDRGGLEWTGVDRGGPEWTGVE